MRIAVVSPGGVGGYFGGLLALAGEDVIALARGQHLTAIHDSGLRVEGPRGDLRYSSKRVTMHPSSGIADVVLFAVKLFQARQLPRRPSYCLATYGRHIAHERHGGS